MASMQPIDIIVALLVVWVLGIVVIFVMSLWLRAPYVPTPMHVTRSMVEFADLRGDEVVYDLGAGDARLLIEAKARFPHVTAKGFELSPPVYLLGVLRIWRSHADVAFAMKNLFAQDVSDADCIFLYLMPGAMKRLQKKFETELRKGTKIISHTFRFPDRTPVKSMTVPWLKGKAKVFLYEW